MDSENKVLYLSHKININTPIYGGITGQIDIESTSNISNGDSSNNSYLKFPAHSGTHIDFPSHFNSKSKSSSDYNASFWVFNKIGFVECDADDLESNLNNVSSEIELLILKTGFGSLRGTSNYVTSQPILKAKFAKTLRRNFPNLKVFGFDLISLTSKLDRDEGKAAHKSFLLEENILILEDMKLDEISSVPSMVIVSPLLFENIDGVPCTVIAIL
jgi:arylformamidase